VVETLEGFVQGLGGLLMHRDSLVEAPARRVLRRVCEGAAR
jgi:hypothetical protein